MTGPPAASRPVATERLWLTEPRRLTSLSKVVAVRGSGFALDRSPFCPKSFLYRHPQLHDQGTVWLPTRGAPEGAAGKRTGPVRGHGEKRKLVRVMERDDGLWHFLRDARPKVGETVQCHLDPHRRLLASRVHTALHLLLHAIDPARDPPLAREPEVKGGGSFRVALDAPHLDRERLAEWLRQVNAWAAADRPVARIHVPRDAAEHRLSPQSYSDGVRFPGPGETMEAVAIEGVGALPCDGTHVPRTSDVGRLVIVEAHPDRSGGFVVIGQVWSA